MSAEFSAKGYSALGDGSTEPEGEASTEPEGDTSTEPEGEASTEPEAGGRVGSGGGVGSAMNRDGMPAIARTMTRTKMASIARIHGRASRSSRLGRDPRYPGSLREGSGFGLWLVVMRRVRLQASIGS
jgi:hypothetical protein